MSRGVTLPPDGTSDNHHTGRNHHGSQKGKGNQGKGKQVREAHGRQGQDLGLVRHFADSTATCRHVARLTGDTCLLAFSGGKDAVASWIRVREHFPRVVPFYRYMIPGLEFVEEGLTSYERAFGQKIHRVPHTSLPRMMRDLTFQSPERCRVVEAAGFPTLDYEDTNDYVRKMGDAKGAYVAVGTRAADSPLRRARIERFGQVNPDKRTFLPIWDWKLDDVIGAIRGAGIKLSVDYKVFGSSFDGIDYKYLLPIKRHFPRDYKRILDWFPMADLELFRRGER